MNFCTLQGFIDGLHGDYRLRPDAAVFQRLPGFKTLPFDEIGRRRP